ncbi:MAG: hypothetical protein ABIJ57_14760 [Pseudomonadota bacterium]
MLYRYVWKNNSKRKTLYGRLCTVIYRGRPNSALVEFENGQREIISRNAIRRIELEKKQERAKERREGYKAGSNGLAATNPAPPD